VSPERIIFASLASLIDTSETRAVPRAFRRRGGRFVLV
jgi:hypothetical protein